MSGFRKSGHICDGISRSIHQMSDGLSNVRSKGKKDCLPIGRRDCTIFRHRRSTAFRSIPSYEGCLQLLGIEKLNTTAHHPDCDGAIERFNQTLKTILGKQAA